MSAQTYEVFLDLYLEAVGTALDVIAIVKVVIGITKARNPVRPVKYVRPWQIQFP